MNDGPSFSPESAVSSSVSTDTGSPTVEKILNDLENLSPEITHQALRADIDRLAGQKGHSQDGPKLDVHNTDINRHVVQQVKNILSGNENEGAQAEAGDVKSSDLADESSGANSQEGNTSAEAQKRLLDEILKDLDPTGMPLDVFMERVYDKLNTAFPGPGASYPSSLTMELIRRTNELAHHWGVLPDMEPFTSVEYKGDKTESWLKENLASDIRIGSSVAVIQALIEALYENRQPNMIAVEALISRAVKDDQRMMNYPDEDGHPLPQDKIPQVPWPDFTPEVLNFIPANRKFTTDKSVPIHGEVTSDNDPEPWTIVAPGILPDVAIPQVDGTIRYNKDPGIFNEDTPLETYTFIAMERLPAEEKLQAVDWTLNVLEKIPALDSWGYLHSLLRVANTAENKDQIYLHMLDFASKHKDRFTIDLERVQEELRPYQLKEGWQFMDEFADIVLGNTNLLTLMSNLEDTQKMKDYLGVLITQRSFPKTIEQVRAALADDSPLTPEQRAGMNKMGLILLGFDPDDPESAKIPVHRSIGEFYSHMHMGNEARTHASRKNETDTVVGVLEEKEITDGTIVDLASGIDESIAAIDDKLKQQGGYNMKYIGVDITPQNALDAEAIIATHPEISHMLGSWDRTNLPAASADLVTILGRSFHHADPKALEAIADEVLRILKPGGSMLFDMANNDTGIYRENRVRFMNFLHEVGAPIGDISNEEGRERVLKHIEWVVDTPDGINFMNRWMPSFERTKKILEDKGFTNVRVIVDLPILDTNEGVDLYVRADKPNGEITTMNAKEVANT